MFGLGAREAAIAAILGDKVVRGLPRAHDVSVDEIVEIAVHGVRGPGQQIHFDGDEVIITTEADAHAESGIIAQRITSLGLAHGHHIRVHIR